MLKNKSSIKYLSQKDIYLIIKIILYLRIFKILKVHKLESSVLNKNTNQLFYYCSTVTSSGKN